MMVGDLTYDVAPARDRPPAGGQQRLREARRDDRRDTRQYPGLVILPAHDPGSGQPPGPGHRPGSDAGDSVAVPGTKMAIDSLEAIQARGTTQWIRVRRGERLQPGAAAGPARPRPTDDQRGAPLRRRCSAWNRPSQSPTGTSAAAVVRCGYADPAGIGLEAVGARYLCPAWLTPVLP